MSTPNTITQFQLLFPEYKRDIAAGSAVNRALRGFDDWAAGKTARATVLRNASGQTATVGMRTAKDLFATSSVFGYFHGGGWAFGLMENDSYRIQLSSYDAYRNMTTTGPLNIYYVDEKNQTWYKTIQVGTDIPKFNDLTQVDKVTWKHDRDLREAAEQDKARMNGGMDKATSHSIWLGDFRRINSELLASSRDITWPPPQRNQFTTDQDFKRAQVLQMQQMISVEYWIEVKIPLGQKLKVASLYGDETIQSILSGLSEDGKARVLRVARETFGAANDSDALALMEDALRVARKDLVVEIASEAGDVLGSSLGRVLAGDNAVGGILYSSLLGEIGTRLAAQVAGGATRAELQMPWASADAMNSFNTQLTARVQQASIGTLSSLLTSELGQALGLRGFGAQLFDTAGTSVLSKAISNATSGANGIFDGFHFERIGEGFGKDAFAANGAGSLMATAIGSFLGAKLGSMVVNPQTQAAGILSSVGSAVGTWALTSSSLGVGTAISTQFGLSSSWLFGNLVLPGVGAFVGFVLGALIGNLFGRKRPTPTASAETTLQVPNARYEVGQATASGGGNVALVTSMALTARDTLNRIIGMVAFNDGPLYVSNLNGQQTDQRYGHANQQIYVKINGAQYNFTSADQAVDFGSLTAIRNTKIIGGDILMKRAISRSPAQSLTALAGDLQIAADYRTYGENAKVINDAITTAYSISAADKQFYQDNKALVDKLQSEGATNLTGAELSTYNGAKAQFDRLVTAIEAQNLANPWIVTLQRVKELGLDQWTASDVYGGFKGFIDSFRPELSLIGYEDVTLTPSGADLIVSITPNGYNTGFFSALPSSSADGRSVTIQSLLSSGLGYTAWDGGAGMAGNNYGNFSGAGGPQTIDDWGGASYYSGGDDIAIGSAYNDAMQGRTGNDWLDGGGGLDTMYGGQGDDVVLGQAGNDLLFGNLGNDYLSGGAGDDQMTAGDGADTLSGKAGVDQMLGEGGDDYFIVNGDGGTTYDWMDGGAGIDTLSYERFGGAVSVDLRTTSYYGDAWSSIENLIGGQGDDIIVGNTVDNLLKGGLGADILWGFEGADILEGGAGSDTLRGGTETDLISYAGSTSGVYVDLTTLEAYGGDAEGDQFLEIEGVRGSAAGDYLRGDAAQNQLLGGQGDDWMVATGGGDSVDGGDGLDFIDFSLATSGVTADLGSSLATAPYNGYATGGFDSAYATLANLEGLRGSDFDDALSGAAGDQIFIGGKGADVMTGGAGSDTYAFGRGDGLDQVNDNGSDANVLSLTGVTYDQLFFGVANGSSSTPSLTVQILGGGGDVLTVNGNYRFDATRNVIKSINIDGAGQISVGDINFARGGDDNPNGITGDSSHWDWINGYGGDDTLSGAAAFEDKGNVFIGGRGADSLIASGGDDQFVMEFGDGADTVSDASGLDTLVFGPSVKPEDLLYEVVGNDLIIGLRDSLTAGTSASQATDRVQIVGGGIRYVSITDPNTTYWNTLEYVSVGGASIELTKLQIPWTDQYYYDGGGISPIVLDLNGDGLDLSTVGDSGVVIKGEDGKLSTVAWAGPSDGFLAVDRNKDGKIDRVSELSFLSDAKGAKTDLEGLRAWDSNQDGKLDATDERFGDLLIWSDRNQNGRSSKGELQTLKEAGIAAIDLKGQPTGQSGPAFESLIYNTMGVTRTDGTTLSAYDVALAHRGLNSELFDGAEIKGDGQFGALLNDPKGEARGGGAGKGPVKLDYDLVARLARTDFSTTDLANERLLARWKAIDAHKTPATVVGMEGAGNLAALDRARTATAKASAAAPIADTAPEDAVAPTANPSLESAVAPRVGAAPSAPPLRDGATMAAAAAAPSEDADATMLAIPLAPDAASLSQAQARDWWRAEHKADVGLDGARPVRTDQVENWEGPTVSRLEGGAEVISAARDQLLLRQALGGFGRDGGSVAALWRASDLERQDLLAVNGRAGLWDRARAAA